LGGGEAQVWDAATGERIGAGRTRAGTYLVTMELGASTLAIWQIDPQRTDARTAAAEIYRSRYAAAPSAELRRHYRTLTSEDLPRPPPLPALPEALIGAPGPLDDLLARAGVGRVITALGSASRAGD
jgi:hypothetical protein